jgi:hypothetical protein
VDLPAQAIQTLLLFLLPGFLAASIWYNLIPTPKPSPFERVVQALILTMLVQALVMGTGQLLTTVGKWRHFGLWSSDVGLAWSLIYATVLGMVMAWLSNTDRLHKLLRRAGITHQTSFSSEWYGAFCQQASYVVLHLNGSRRLFGWPQEWPSTPEIGHFVIVQAEWLEDGRRLALPETEKILVRATDVEMVEFLPPKT